MMMLLRFAAVLTCVLVLAWAAPVPVHSQIQDERPFHVVAIDLSGSTLKTDPQCHALSAARVVIDNFTPGRVGLITFAGEEATVQGAYDLAVPGERQAAYRALQELRNSCGERQGNTPLADAVAKGADLLNTEDAPPGSSLILTTDGEPWPNSQAQYARIRELAPGFKERGWLLLGVGLGDPSAPWVAELRSVVAGADGAFNAAGDVLGVQDLFLALFQQVTGQSLLALHDSVISPTVGAVEVPLAVDPTMREVTIVAFYDQPGVRLRLFAPDGSELGTASQLVDMASTDDPFYDLWRLRGGLPAGKWRVVVGGSGRALVRALYRSSLTLELLSPPAGGLLPLKMPGPIQVRLRDADTGEVVFEPVTVAAELRGPNGSVLSAQLFDDGDVASGDEARADGVYTARLAPPDSGPMELVVTASSPAFSVNTRTTLTVEPFPALVMDGGTVFRDVERGSTVRIPLRIEMEGKPYSTEFLEEVTGSLLTPEGGVVAEGLAPHLDGDELTFSVKPQATDAEGDLVTYVLEVDYRGTYRGSPFSFAYHSPPLEFHLIPPTTPWRLYLALTGGGVGLATAAWGAWNYWRRPRRTRALFVSPPTVRRRERARADLAPALRRMSLASLVLGRYEVPSERLPGLWPGLVFRFDRRGRVRVRRRLLAGANGHLEVRPIIGKAKPVNRWRWHELRARDRLSDGTREMEFQSA